MENLDYQSAKTLGKPMVLDFYAQWCGPCKTISPMIEDLSIEYQESVIIGKIDVEESDDLSVEFKIRSVPTIVFLDKTGTEVSRLVGAQTKAKIEENIKKLIAEE